MSATMRVQTVFAVALLGLGVIVAAASGGTTAQTTATGAQRTDPGPRGGMADRRQAMRLEADAQVRKLDELVALMNAATDADRVDRVAAVVTELVAQHKAMRARMGAMPMMAPGATAPGRADGPSASPSHEGH